MIYGIRTWKPCWQDSLPRRFLITTKSSRLIFVREPKQLCRFLHTVMLFVSWPCVRESMPWASLYLFSFWLISDRVLLKKTCFLTQLSTFCMPYSDVWPPIFEVSAMRSRPDIYLLHIVYVLIILSVRSSLGKVQQLSVMQMDWVLMGCLAVIPGLLHN